MNFHLRVDLCDLYPLDLAFLLSNKGHRDIRQEEK